MGSHSSCPLKLQSQAPKNRILLSPLSYVGPTPLSPLPTAPHASPAPRSGAPAARPKLRREDLGGTRGRDSGGRGWEGPPLWLVSPTGAGAGGGQHGEDLLRWRSGSAPAAAAVLNGLEKSERMGEVDLRRGAAPWRLWPGEQGGHVRRPRFPPLAPAAAASAAAAAEHEAGKDRCCGS